MVVGLSQAGQNNLAGALVACAADQDEARGTPQNQTQCNTIAVRERAAHPLVETAARVQPAAVALVLE